MSAQSELKSTKKITRTIKFDHIDPTILVEFLRSMTAHDFRCDTCDAEIYADSLPIAIINFLSIHKPFRRRCSEAGLTYSLMPNTVQ